MSYPRYDLVVHEPGMAGDYFHLEITPQEASLLISLEGTELCNNQMNERDYNIDDDVDSPDHWAFPERPDNDELPKNIRCWLTVFDEGVIQ